MSCIPFNLWISTYMNKNMKYKWISKRDESTDRWNTPCVKGSEVWVNWKEACRWFSHCKIFCLHVFGAFHITYISPSVSLLDVCGWQVYSINCRGGREHRERGRERKRGGCVFLQRGTFGFIKDMILTLTGCLLEKTYRCTQTNKMYLWTHSKCQRIENSHYEG